MEAQDQSLKKTSRSRLGRQARPDRLESPKTASDSFRFVILLKKRPIRAIGIGVVVAACLAAMIYAVGVYTSFLPERIIPVVGSTAGVLYSPDGRYLVYGTREWSPGAPTYNRGAVYVVSTATRRVTDILPTWGSPLSMCFSTDGSLFAVADAMKSDVDIYSVRRSWGITTIRLPVGWIATNLVYSDLDGCFIASIETGLGIETDRKNPHWLSGTMALYRVSPEGLGSQICTLPRTCYSLTVDPTGRYIASAHGNVGTSEYWFQIDIIDVTTGAAIASIPCGQEDAFVFSRDGKVLYVYDNVVGGVTPGLSAWKIDGPVRLWRAETDSYWAEGVAVSPSGRVLAASGGDQVRFFDARSGRLMMSAPWPSAGGSGASSSQTCSFSPDGRNLAVMRSDSVMVVRAPRE